MAHVWLSDNKGSKLTPIIGTASNVKGEYSLDTTQNTNATHITASYVGYGKTTAPILSNSTKLDLSLGETDTLLNEFEVEYDKTADNKKKLKKILMYSGISLALIIIGGIIIKKS